MSKRAEMEESAKSTLKAIDESMKLTAAQNNSIPLLQERKMETNALLLLIQHATDDEIDEIYSKLLPLQKRDEQSYVQFVFKQREVQTDMENIYVNSSGTSSTSYELVHTQIRRIQPSVPAEPVYVAFREVAEYKSRKAEIPKRLNHLQPELGRMFSVVHDTVEKARRQVISVKDAISDMRDVLHHIWRNFVSAAKTRHPGKFRSSASEQFKKSGSRRNLAECLMNEPLNVAKFQLLLDNMYSLYTDMSQVEIGKNPLNDDLSQLEDYYSRWIIHIDGVVGMINWREWEGGLPPT
jgi:hypothetical protein